MNLKVCLSLSFLVIGLTACSGKGSNPSSSANGGGGGGIGSREEALNALSPEHRANFLKWQSSVVKSCDASQAFKNESSSENGIDAKALILKNNNSVVFSENNVFAVLRSYTTLSGISNTSTEETTTINGVTNNLKAETKREGSNCSVILFGQKVYETVMAESFNVGTYFNPNRDVTSSSIINSNLAVVKNLGINGAGIVEQDGVYTMLASALAPAKEGQLMIGQKLGLTDEDALRFIKIGNNSSNQSIVRIDGINSAVWSSYQYGNLIADYSILNNYFDGNTHSLPLEVRLEIAQFDIFGTTNSSDLGNLALSATASVSRLDNKFTYVLKKLENKGLIAFNQTEAETCVNNRFTAHFKKDEKTIAPTTPILFNPCRTLFAEIEKVSYTNGFLKSKLPQVFANIRPSRDFYYNGWDIVLSYFAKSILNEGKNISAQLDPDHQSNFISIVSSQLDYLNSEISKVQNLSKLKDALYDMGLSWSFNNQNVNSGKVVQIIQAIDNTALVFAASSKYLINNLANNSNQYDDQLLFAQGIDAAYKNEALNSLSIANDISYKDFERDIFNQVIQKKVSIDELKDWGLKFNSISVELNKFSNLAAIKGDLVGLSLKWLKSGEISSQNLPSVYSALDNVTTTFTESSKVLMSNLKDSLNSTSDTLSFCRSITPEYKTLALSIRDGSQAAGFKSWGETFFNSILQKKPSIDQLRVWNDSWQAIIGFTQHEKELLKNESSTTTSEWNRKKVIELAIGETWSQLDFNAFNSIAELASFKNSCDHYIDSSSRANCAGMDLFSKKGEKFFAPKYNGRYTQLSINFKTYMQKLSDNEWTTLRWNMLNEFFNSSAPIWSKCEMGVFNQKAADLNNYVNGLLNEKDYSRKWELERKIKETINNCQ